MSLRRVLVVVRVGVLALILWLLLGMVQLFAASLDLRTARKHVTNVRGLSLEADLAVANRELSAAATSFDRARRSLGGMAAAPARRLPVMGDDIVVVERLAAAGAGAARAGQTIVEAVRELPGQTAALAPAGGRLPIEVYRDLAAPLGTADTLLQDAMSQLGQTADVDVFADVAAARTQLNDLLPPVAATVRRGAALARTMPSFLGADGRRRYLFVAQNPAEARGTGGFLGAYSVLTVDDGRLDFERFDEIHVLPSYNAAEVDPPTLEFGRRYNRYGGAGYWLNINMTPDFPTASQAMLALYEKGTDERLDGVIAADPYAFQALLTLTGPVPIPGFGRVSSDNVVDVVSNRAHAELEDSVARKRLLGAVATSAFNGLVRSGRSVEPGEVVGALGEIAGDGHLLLHAGDDEVQAALVDAGVAGELLDPPGDFLAVVGNAGSAAKLDYYVQRSITYDVRLEPGGGSSSRVSVTLDNDAPRRGISDRVIGPNARGLSAGEQRLILSLFAPGDSAATTFSRSGGRQPLQRETELGKAVYSTVVEVPGGGSRTIAAALQRDAAWEETQSGGRYQLTVQGQTVLRPTLITINVALPAGTAATVLPDGVRRLPDGRLSYRGELGRSLTLDLPFERP